MLTLMAMSVANLQAVAQSGYEEPLTYNLPNPNHSPEGTKRNPANFDCLPETWISGGYLHFLGSEDIALAGVVIWDEYDNEVLSTSVMIVEDLVSSIDISNLSSGSYYLFIIVDGVVYEAYFEL